MSLLEHIYNSDQTLYYSIVCFYEKFPPAKYLFKKDLFLDICKSNYIDIIPERLFYFFDTLHIKIGVVPMKHDTNLFSAFVFYNDNVTITSGIETRKQATEEGIKSAIRIYIQANNPSINPSSNDNQEENQENKTKEQENNHSNKTQEEKE